MPHSEPCSHFDKHTLRHTDTVETTGIPIAAQQLYAIKKFRRDSLRHVVIEVQDAESFAKAFVHSVIEAATEQVAARSEPPRI